VNLGTRRCRLHSDDGRSRQIGDQHRVESRKGSSGSGPPAHERRDRSRSGICRLVARERSNHGGMAVHQPARARARATSFASIVSRSARADSESAAVSGLEPSRESTTGNAVQKGRTQPTTASHGNPQPVEFRTHGLRHDLGERHARRVSDRDIGGQATRGMRRRSCLPRDVCRCAFMHLLVPTVDFSQEPSVPRCPYRRIEDEGFGFGSARFRRRQRRLFGSEPRLQGPRGCELLHRTTLPSTLRERGPFDVRAAGPMAQPDFPQRKGGEICRSSRTMSGYRKSQARPSLGHRSLYST